MDRASLTERAERAGILSRYTASGGEVRATPDRTRALLLDALASGATGSAAARGARSGRGRAAGRAAPTPCASVAERLGERRAFGLWANLYSLRSERGIGIGNLGDLRALVRFAADAGAVFVGLSPLHAIRNRPPDVSPYQPLTRLFRNALYLDPTLAPEWESAPAARRQLEEGAGAAARRRLLAAARIDYAGCADLHAALLAHLYRAFREQHLQHESPRGRAFAAFVRNGGTLLRDFAVFCALEEDLAARGTARDWRRWPAEFRSPSSPQVRRFCDTHAEAIERNLYAQFELDRQLAFVAEEARAAGLPIGFYADLAVGSALSGFDTWAFPDLFLADVSLGAPPDDYAAQGQDWGMPPMHPQRLVDDDFRYWRTLLRAGFAHAGMLRIDHVMSVLRQFWIPAGEPASAGAYVRFPALELLGVLGEESRRAGALVVGEDLGTVPRGLPSLLARYAVLSSRVLLFERDRRGTFRPAHRYPTRVLVTANTHDVAPLASYWEGEDLALRQSLGLWGGAGEFARARKLREAARRALLRRLSADADLAGDAMPEYPDLCAAIHRFLCRTPASLIGVSLDDLAAETQPVNLPGVPQEIYASWTRRMASSVDSLAVDPGVLRALDGTSERAWRAP